MASLRQRLDRVHEDISYGKSTNFADPIWQAFKALGKQTRRAWKLRQRLHKCYAVIGAMDVEKWQIIQLNQILRGAIIEQEIVINELRAELLKHTSVLS